MPKLIGIFGGTFDPVHKGHIAIAEQLLQQLPLEEIQLIPCHSPVHRAEPGATAQDRLAMLKLATAQSPDNLTINTIEMERPTLSYMAETLEALEKQYDNETHLALIMGYDAWQHFTHWHRWQTILELAHIILVHRPNYQLPANGLLLNLLKRHQVEKAEALLASKAGKILLQPDYHIPISATTIRKSLKTRTNLHQFLPQTIIDYIQAHQLYQSEY